MQAAALDISYKYRSPRNPERKVRPTTTLIVLHTTEAPAQSSLNKVSERGECHYCVAEDGTVYAIVDRDKEAFHAGRSMWSGKEDVDRFAVGIECVGYHDKPMPLVQLKAISALVKDLQKRYRVADQGVVAHSHVAYGAPNKWFKKKHRGRKRCGMLFATQTIRKILELKAKPASDPDVKARRLTAADPYLEQVLYRNNDIMAKHYPKDALKTSPKPAVSKPAEKTGWKDIGKKDKPKSVVQVKPKVVDKPKPKPAEKPKVADKPKAADKPKVADKAKPNAQATATSAAPKSIAELKKRGYVVKGVIQPGKTASQIAGGKWNSADTYYTIRDKVFSGKTVNPAKFEKGMSVWMKK